MNSLLEGLLQLEEKYKDRIAGTRKRIGYELKRQREKRKMTLRQAAEEITAHSGKPCDFSNLRKVENGLDWSEPVVRRAFEYYKSHDTP